MPDENGSLSRPTTLVRISGYALIAIGVAMLVVRSNQWIAFLADDTALPGNRLSRSVTDIAAIFFIGFGSPLAAGWRSETWSDLTHVGPFRLPRYVIWPGIAIMAAIAYVIAGTALASGSA